MTTPKIPVIERARRYVTSIRAIAGAGGHASTFAAAVALVKGFSLPPDTALELLRRWNETNADPPWTEPELVHKIREAAKSPKSPGFLLANNRPETALHAIAGGGRPFPRREDEEKASKALLRRRWPAFRPLSREETRRLAALRRVSPEAVALLAHAGILRAATVDGHACAIFHEGTFAQARRLDGRPLRLRDGREVKAKNLPGSEGVFIGRKLLGTAKENPVLLTEGAAGLLEALACALAVDADLRSPAGWTVLAAVSAGSRFNAEWLALLAGRRVRILPDLDAAGLAAAGVWSASLRRAGCRVDVVELPAGMKDLGPVAASPGDHRQLLNELFTP